MKLAKSKLKVLPPERILERAQNAAKDKGYYLLVAIFL